MPFWLWVGIAALVLSVMIPAIRRIIRREKDETWRLRYETEHKAHIKCAEIVEYLERFQTEHNRLIELGRSVDGILNPAQIEILRLRSSIMDWLSDLPECPVMDTTGLEADNADRHTAAHNLKLSEWSERIRHAYAIEFAPKVVEVVHKLGLEGLDVRGLEARSSSVGTPDEASEIIIELGDLALQADGRAE